MRFKVQKKILLLIWKIISRSCSGSYKCHLIPTGNLFSCLSMAREVLLFFLPRPPPLPRSKLKTQILRQMIYQCVSPCLLLSLFTFSNHLLILQGLTSSSAQAQPNGKPDQYLNYLTQYFSEYHLLQSPVFRWIGIFVSGIWIPTL